MKMKRLTSLLISIMMILQMGIVSAVTVSASRDLVYTAQYGTPVIDGVYDEAWENGFWTQIDLPYSKDGALSVCAVRAKVMNDENLIYFLVEVADATTADGNGDAFEIYLDEDRCRADAYCDVATQLQFYLNGNIAKGANSRGDVDMVKEYVVGHTDDGYVLEIAIEPLKGIPTDAIGLEFSYTDADEEGTFLDCLRWNADTAWGDTAPWQSLECFGELICSAYIPPVEPEEPIVPEDPTPDAPVTGTNSIAYLDMEKYGYLAADAEMDAAYLDGTVIPVNFVNDKPVAVGTDGTANVYMLTNDGLLFVYAEVYDTEVVEPTEEAHLEYPWESDCIELFIDPMGDDVGNVYHFRVDSTGYPSFDMNWDSVIIANGPEAAAPYFHGSSYAAQPIDGGYAVEFCIDLKAFDVNSETELALNLVQVDIDTDADFRMISSCPEDGFDSYSYNRYLIGVGETYEGYGRPTPSRGTCGDSMTYTLDENGCLTVSGEGEMWWDPFGPVKHAVTSVVIEEGITNINGYAFAGMNNLESVTLPDSLEWIGACAFRACQSLREIVIPDSVEGIAEYAFENCPNLESVTFGNSVAYLGDSAFRDCVALKEVILPDSVEVIELWAFAGCSALETLVLNGNIAVIRDHTFCACESLTEVILPDSVEIIEPWAFQGCFALESVTLGDSVSYIGDGAFMDDVSLKEIIIPDSVTEIGISAFAGCYAAETLILGATLTKIGEAAFLDCFNLEAIYFTGNAPAAIDAGAFWNTSSSLKMYFFEGSEGWTTPAWVGPNGHGYTTVMLAADTEIPVEPKAHDLESIPFVNADVIVVDGEMDEAYENGALAMVDQRQPGHGVTGALASVSMLTNNGLLYLYADVIDPDVVIPSEELQANAPWEADSLEFIFQTRNGVFDDIHQFRLDVTGYPCYYRNDYGDVQAYGDEARAYFEAYDVVITEHGYAIEACIDTKQFGVSAEEVIAIQMQINDMTSENTESVASRYHYCLTDWAWDTDVYDEVVIGVGEAYETTRGEDPQDIESIPYVDADVISVDGVKDEIYSNGANVTVDQHAIGANKGASAQVSMMTNNGLLYVFADVTDTNVIMPTEDVHVNAPWEADSVEFLFQTRNGVFADIHQFRVDVVNYLSYYRNADGNPQAYGEEAEQYFVAHEAVETENGYAVEFCIDTKQFGVSANEIIAIQMQLNDMTENGWGCYNYRAADGAFNADCYDEAWIGIDEAYETTREPDVPVTSPDDIAFENLSFSEFAHYEQGTLEAIQMRAFAVDPNGKYYYGGLLTNGIPTVYQFNAESGDPVCSYQFDPNEDEGAFIKAIAADDRGYVYMGVANNANEGAVYFAICSEDGLSEIKWVKIEIDGKIGVNGAYVRQFGDKYYLYFVTNYDTDRLYCYDVTDVNNPELNTAFGTDGYIDLSTAFDMNIVDINNIVVDEEGYIYMCANTGAGSKGDTVLKISTDGVVDQAAIPECFGIALLDRGYVAVCTYEGADSKVYILNQQALSTVKMVGYDDANYFSQLGMIGNRIYVANERTDSVLISSEINFSAPDEPIVKLEESNRGNLAKVHPSDIRIDGEIDEAAWENALPIPIDMYHMGDVDTGTYGEASLLWADNAWYLAVDVKDEDVVTPSEDAQMYHPWNTDSVEIFFDFGNKQEELTKQYRVDCMGWPSFSPDAGATILTGDEAAAYFSDFAVCTTDDGYRVEMCLDMSEYNLTSGYEIGIQLQINDMTKDISDGTTAVYVIDSAMGAGSWDAHAYDYVVLSNSAFPDQYEKLWCRDVIYGTPDMDGVFTDGEWDSNTAIIINENNAMAWAGDTISDVVMYHAWDENGLYLAGKLTDEDVCLAPSLEEVYNLDAMQIALDPGGLIGQADLGGAMFFSIGPLEDGTLGAVYHPYGGAAEAFEYTGVYTFTNSGWQFEMMIPWTSIEILAEDGFAWTHGGYESIKALFCVLDRDEGGAIANCYQTTNCGAVTFRPYDYPYELTLIPANDQPDRFAIPYVDAGIIDVDGYKDDAYDRDTAVVVNQYTTGINNGAFAEVSMMTNNGLLYVFADVTDTNVIMPSDDIHANAPWEADSVEFLFQTRNAIFDDIHQFRVDVADYLSYYRNADGDKQAYGDKAEQYFAAHSVIETENGYAVEFCIDTKQFGVSANEIIAIQMQLNDMTNDGWGCYNYRATDYAFNTDVYEEVWIGVNEEYATTRRIPAVKPAESNRGYVAKVDHPEISVDGTFDESAWNNALQIPIDTRISGDKDTGTYGKAYLLWADNAWYIAVDVKDKDVVIPSEDAQMNYPWVSDSVEIFFDYGNKQEELTKQYRLDWTGWPSFSPNEGKTMLTGDEAAARFNDFAVCRTDDGYRIEMCLDMAKYNPTNGYEIGIQLQINDMTSANADDLSAIYVMSSALNASSWDAHAYDYVVLGDYAETASDIKITVSDTVVMPGQEAIVYVNIDENPGFNYMQLELDYDSSFMTLTSVDYGNFGGATAFDKNYTWSAGPVDIYGTGTLMTLHFAVSDVQMEGEYYVTVSKGSAGINNVAEKPLTLSVESGSVAVALGLAGDINHDGVCDGRDVTRMIRHLNGEAIAVDALALDTNGDNAVDGRDATRLVKVLNGENIALYYNGVAFYPNN